jgi:hypothetical protein
MRAVLASIYKRMQQKVAIPITQRQHDSSSLDQKAESLTTFGRLPLSDALGLAPCRSTVPPDQYRLHGAVVA